LALTTTELSPEWWSLFDLGMPDDIVLRATIQKACRISAAAG